MQVPHQFVYSWEWHVSLLKNLKRYVDQARTKIDGSDDKLKAILAKGVKQFQVIMEYIKVNKIWTTEPDVSKGRSEFLQEWKRMQDLGTAATQGFCRVSLHQPPAIGRCGLDALRRSST